MVAHSGLRVCRAAHSQLSQSGVAAVLHSLVLCLSALPRRQVCARQASRQGSCHCHHHNHDCGHCRHRRHCLPHHPAHDRAVSEAWRRAHPVGAADHPHQQPHTTHQRVGTREPTRAGAVLPQQRLQRRGESLHAQALHPAQPDCQHCAKHHRLLHRVALHVLHIARL